MEFYIAIIACLVATNIVTLWFAVKYHMNLKAVASVLWNTGVSLMMSDGESETTRFMFDMANAIDSAIKGRRAHIMDQ